VAPRGDEKAMNTFYRKENHKNFGIVDFPAFKEGGFDGAGHS
jgi:hypothetical protein